MDRSLPQANPFAGMDAKRIAGNSLAVVIHVLAIGILLRPSEWEPPARPAKMEVVPIEIFVKPEEFKIPDPPPERPREEPVVQRPLQPIVQQQPVTPAADEVPLFETGDIEAVPVAEGQVVDSFEPGPPALATLMYDVYPAPRYPRNAQRNGHTGRVTLRVLVDEQGWPKEVLVEKTSGHRELDRAAREQVLAKWRFHPAQRQGRTVPAYALVPIDFNLP